MKTKLQKSQLILLFTLFVINSLYFLYSESLPDNMYEISSKSEGINSVFYYVMSFISLIGFYIGPWIVFPFFSFAIIYSLIVVRKELKYDLALPVLLSLFSFGICYFLMPTFIGQGLLYTFDTYFSGFAVFGISFLSGFGILAVCDFF